MFSSKKALLKFLDIRENFLYDNFSDKYWETTRPKKDGGVRTIKPPNSKLKKIQRKILDGILYHYPQLQCVYGLSKNKDIFYNAKAHQKNANNQLLVLDIENFFPSITSRQVKQVFLNLKFSKENASLLTKICTIENSLPQGAPTSPYLASMVCAKLDKEIYIYCKRRQLIYTRYFDDISISGKNISSNCEQTIKQIITRGGFVCNKDKRDFFDSNTLKIINSVVITQSGFSVSDKYKQEIKKAHERLLKDPSPQNRRYFAGKFGFYLHINKKEALTFQKTF